MPAISVENQKTIPIKEFANLFPVERLAGMAAKGGETPLEAFRQHINRDDRTGKPFINIVICDDELQDLNIPNIAVYLDAMRKAPGKTPVLVPLFQEIQNALGIPAQIVDTPQFTRPDDAEYCHVYTVFLKNP